MPMLQRGVMMSNVQGLITAITVRVGSGLE